MRKLIWLGGERMQLEEQTQPPPHPQKDHVLVKVRSVGICGTDIHITNGTVATAKPPMILGHEFAGEIVETGENVGNVHEGDRVTVDSVVGCGHCSFCLRGARQFCPNGFEFGISADGGSQDYLIVPKQNVYRIPDTITFEEAAILDTEIYNAVEKCGIDRGDRVLVLGAGPIGLITCQIVHIQGAGHVTLGDVLEHRLGSAEALGMADKYLAIEQGDSDEPAEEKAFEPYDVVIDCAGGSGSVRHALRTVKLGGRILLYAVHEKPADKLDLNQIVLKDLVVYGAQSDRDGWEDVIDLVQSGRLNLKSLITHRSSIEKGSQAYDLVRHRKDGVIKAILLL